MRALPLLRLQPEIGAENQRIRGALDRCRGNRTRAARELGMSRNTLRDRMRRYDL